MSKPTSPIYVGEALYQGPYRILEPQTRRNAQIERAYDQGDNRVDLGYHDQQHYREYGDRRVQHYQGVAHATPLPGLGPAPRAELVFESTRRPPILNSPSLHPAATASDRAARSEACHKRSFGANPV